MAKPTCTLICAAVVMALAAPQWVNAQAVPRSSAPGSSSSGNSGSSSNGSSASPANTAVVRPGPSETNVPESPRAAPADQRGGGARSAPSGARTGSTAQPRPSGSSAQPAGSPRASAPGGPPPNGAPGTAVGRYRNGQPTQGTAVPRQPGNYPGYPIYGYPGYGYGYWYPWYGPGFGYGYGYYNPWWYGSFGFYGGYPYGYGGYGAYSGGGYAGEYQSVATGSIRLRVSPETAKVYIDGTLMGTVDDFNGLGHHLDLPAGQHQIELRADGYETYTGTIDVLVGKTMTERVSLNKKK